MKTNLATISGDASVADAASQMAALNVGSLLVCSPSGAIDAIVTERDLVRKSLASGNVGAKVVEVASSPLLKIDAGADISAAAEAMGAKKVKRLVVEQDGKLKGIISQVDIIRITPSLYDLIARSAS